jgi:molybdopterin converting factor small subunit
MSIEIHLFYPSLQEITGRQIVRAEGTTVGECLSDLVQQFPGAKNWIFDSSGQLLEYTFAYINADSARKAALSDPIAAGDKILLALMVTGG